MRKFFAFFLVLIIFPTQIFATPKIASLLANPENGMENEFIEIVNPTCDEKNLSGYTLAIGNKQFTFPENIISPNEKVQFLRSETRLWLRDAGDTIILFDEKWEKIDEITYTKDDAKKWNILNFSHEIASCDAENPDNEEKIEEDNSRDNQENSENSQENKEEENQENPDENISENNENFESLIAEEIHFSVNENKNSIEEISIIFDETLTGSLDITKINFATLSGSEILETPKNFEIISAQILENSLEISLSWSLTFDEILWNNSENFSGIFLKIDDFDGISSISDKKILPLDENSFEKYTKIVKNFSENNKEDNDENPENGDKKTDENSEKEENENIFPEIFPTLQRSTTAYLKGNILFCHEDPCKINLDFEEIFSSEFDAKNFSCEIIMDDRTINSCNPPQSTFTADAEIIFKLTHKTKNSEKIQTFLVDFSEIQNDDSTEKKENSENKKSEKNSTKTPSKSEKSKQKIQKFSTSPIIKIDSDGNFEKMYEWKNDEEIRCLKQKCVINLNASESYSAEDMNLKFSWKFGNISDSNRKNPSAVTFEAGNHEIILSVKDENNHESTRKIMVFVPNEDEEKLENPENETEKIEMKNEEISFIEPEIILQNPLNFEKISENSYICKTKTESCSANFTLIDADKNFSYFWKWNENEIFESMNPRSEKLPIGKNKLVVMVYRKENRDEKIFEKNIEISVQKIETAKKTTKKISKKSANQKKKSTKKSEKNPEEIPEKSLEEEKVEIKNEENHIPVSLAGMLVSSLLFARMRKKL